MLFPKCGLRWKERRDGSLDLFLHVRDWATTWLSMASFSDVASPSLHATCPPISMFELRLKAVCIHLSQRIPTRNDLPLSPGDICHVWRYFWLSQLGFKMLLASHGQRPGMVPNILQCTGQPPCPPLHTQSKCQ
jgi:hypothetical protein